jgi:hypothetical protein
VRRGTSDELGRDHLVGLARGGQPQDPALAVREPWLSPGARIRRGARRARSGAAPRSEKGVPQDVVPVAELEADMVDVRALGAAVGVDEALAARRDRDWSEITIRAPGRLTRTSLTSPAAAR